jgi:hypothetical protein
MSRRLPIDRHCSLSVANLLPQKSADRASSTIPKGLSLQLFLQSTGFTCSLSVTNLLSQKSRSPCGRVFWREFSFSLPTFYCRKFFSLVIASIYKIQNNYKNINCLYLSSKEERIWQLFSHK